MKYVPKDLMTFVFTYIIKLYTFHFRYNFNKKIMLEKTNDRAY